ncbi:DUF1802 family protein [Planctomicrobium sp. SH527]|uniref:DUF1802 family protein n=1 Tax=Planctomicrobium sp. SH527 TaxID=3448123 RepID=UPI003F5C3F73
MGSSRIALKEWAVICDSLAAGEQLILFRKGGIHEGPAGFTPEHQEFWLFPTGFHQALDSVREEFQPAAQATLQQSPPPGTLPIRHFCRISGVCWMNDEERLAHLRPFHILTDDALLTRFRYRRPGIFLLTVDVRSLPASQLLPTNPIYDGCHSWVSLNEEVETDSLLPPVVSPDHAARLAELHRLFPELASRE